MKESLNFLILLSNPNLFMSISWTFLFEEGGTPQA